MTNWAAFAGFTTAVLGLLLFLAHATQTAISGRQEGWLDTTPDGADHLDVEREMQGRLPVIEPSPGVVYANVTVVQSLFLLLLAAGAWYADVPAAAFGLAVTPRVLVVGVGFGVALSAANTVAGVLARMAGYHPAETVRELLAPERPRDWVLLLGVVLPVIAVFEEFLFRGALIGAFAVGFGVSPWLLAVVSSVAFALGHGAQGAVGVVVTGTLGFVLAAGYVLTGSLAVVVVAHYLVNALEFVVYEALGLELAGKG